MTRRVVESRKAATVRSLDDFFDMSPDEVLFDLYEQARRDVILALPEGSNTDATAMVTVSYQVFVGKDDDEPDDGDTIVRGTD